MSKTISLKKVAKYSDARIPIKNVTINNFITTDNLLQNKLGITKATSLPPQEGNMPAYFKNDILVGNIRPYLKKIWFADKDGGNSADVLTIKVNEKHNPKFIYYALYRDDFFEHMMKGSKGTKMPRGDKNQIMDFSIPDISLEREEKIANILSFLDSKIELNNKINKELESMAKTLYDYWFVQFDFPDENGKPYKSSGGKMVYNQELKREIPISWENKQLNQIVTTSNQSVNPYANPKNIYKYYSIPIFDETKTFGLEYGNNIKSNKFVVSEKDILVSKLNPWFNRIIYPIQTSNMICSTEFVVWRTESNEIKNYLYIIARNQQFIDYCINSATGTSNSHRRVNPDIMMKFKVPYSLIIAKLFGLRMQPLLKMIATNQQENQELAKLRDWLLPMLMNGQVRVK